MFLKFIFLFVDRSSSSTNIDNEDLINMGIDNALSVLDIFDPLNQPARSQVLPSVITPNIDTSPPVPSIPSPSYPYPIKLRLKLTACSEMKPFSQLVQQIRNERQSNQVKENKTFS